MSKSILPAAYLMILVYVFVGCSSISHPPTPINTAAPTPVSSTTAVKTITTTPSSIPPTVTLATAFPTESIIIDRQSQLGTWEKVTVPTNLILLSVDFTNQDNGWAVGEAGVMIRWDGKVWTPYASPVDVNLYQVKLLSKDNGWAVGRLGTILHWDGQSWNIVNSPTKYDLYDISFIDKDSGWAVGGYEDPNAPRHTIIVDRVILRWDGINWYQVPNPVIDMINYPLFAVHMVTEQDGWILGDAGTILHWDGVNWEKKDEMLDGLLKSVSSISTNDVWMAGSDYPNIPGPVFGIIYYWDGYEWEKSYSTVDNAIYTIAMVSQDYGWAGGGQVPGYVDQSLLLHWNGEEWKEIKSPTDLPVKYIWANNRSDGWLLAGHLGEKGEVYRYIELDD